jgi:hypothetical protein
MSILSAPGRPGQCQTVHEVIEMYLAQARRDLSDRSYETVSCILHRFDDAAGQLTLAECRPFDLQCWLNEHPEYRSEWYRRCVISSIKRAFPENGAAADHPTGADGSQALALDAVSSTRFVHPRTGPCFY